MSDREPADKAASAVERESKLSRPRKILHTVIASVLGVAIGGGAGVAIAELGIESNEAHTEPLVRAFDPADYETPTNATLTKLAKYPDHYKGKSYVIYGRVMQPASMTGNNAFHAAIGAKRLDTKTFRQYRVNSLLAGLEDVLGKVDKGALFQAYVTVRGSVTDEAAGGGRTTPLLQVNHFNVYAHT